MKISTPWRSVGYRDIPIDQKSKVFIKVISLYFQRSYGVFYDFFRLWRQVITWFNWGLSLIIRTYVWYYSVYGLVRQHTFWIKILEAWARFQPKRFHFLYRHGFNKVILIIKQNWSVSRRVELRYRGHNSLQYIEFWVQEMCVSAEFPFEVWYVGAAYGRNILTVSSVKEDYENRSLETIHGQNMSDSSKWDKRLF